MFRKSKVLFWETTESPKQTSRAPSCRDDLWRESGREWEKANASRRGWSNTSGTKYPRRGYIRRHNTRIIRRRIPVELKIHLRPEDRRRHLWTFLWAGRYRGRVYLHTCGYTRRTTIPCRRNVSFFFFHVREICAFNRFCTLSDRNRRVYLHDSAFARDAPRCARAAP